ncbi:MAG: ion transporter [Proteobacteria bacterium]|nr:ion transporter [Pseudomonadota bacterium]
MNSLRKKIELIIFEADTFAGKLFDIILIISIAASVFVVMLDSVESYALRYGSFFIAAEWFFTVLFTMEYLLRLATVEKPLKYAGSFFGIIDFLAIIPSYAGLFFPGGKYLLVIRVLRVLRVFRVLKLAQYIGEAELLIKALRASRRKVIVFIFTVLTIVTIIGSAMYIIEGQENGFTSIPKSIYWAVVTLTTVGYGDISPQTSIGQALAAVVMILGFGIIAIPTGIVTAELTRAIGEQPHSRRTCPGCRNSRHEADARYCRLCGHLLP